ncbi:hypothetical protein AVEN_193753-1 [Araneus ventricosus]|uniref:CCHC-type domain-containing protein n=1 Tax=Araneus ventricosus TaxID=182803 RepID=A0A4Y2DNM6_ARAVE|nr:hypothetical protein AVEN_193753-1 [Araneus ventricosus]
MKRKGRSHESEVDRLKSVRVQRTVELHVPLETPTRNRSEEIDLADQVNLSAEKFINPKGSEEENLVTLTEKLKLSKFIEALRSDIRVEVKKLGPKSFKSAIAMAKNIDNALSEDSGEFNATDSGINQILSQQLDTNKQIMELSERVNAISTQNMAVNSLTEAPSTSSNVQINQQIQCQICGKFNHIARNCFLYTRGRFNRGNNRLSNNRTFRSNSFHPYRSRTNQRSNFGRNFRGNFKSASNRGFRNDLNF